MADETNAGMGDTTGRAGASNDPVQKPAPQGAPEGVPPGAPSLVDGPQIKQDFAKILSEIKLPERHDFRASGDTKIEPKGIPLSNALDELERPLPETPAAGEGAPQTQPTPDSEVVPVHTLKQDLQHIVQDQKISYVRAVALEEDRHRSTQIQPRERAPRQPSYARGVIFTAIALLFVGSAALAGVYLAQVMNATPIPQQSTDSLVFAEQSVPFTITGVPSSDLKGRLAQARSSAHGSLGSITRLVPVVTASSSVSGQPTQRAATLGEFFTAIGAQAPADLMRALSDQFFLGLHTVDTNAPFLVIPITDYDRAFSGMLSWEPAIDADLSPFFTAVPQYTTGPSGIPAARTFADVVMRNYDVRALKNDAGQIVLYYSFPTRTILIIAESPYTFTEVLTRLQAQRRL